jgi:hypothetical protein
VRFCISRWRAWPRGRRGWRSTNRRTTPQPIWSKWSSRRRARAPVSAAPDTAAVAKPKPQEAASRLALSRANLFPEQTWFVAPPPPPPPPPYVPPPPQAPALPFSYMGRWQDDAQTTYYLMRGTLPLSVRAGQVLDGVWRLEPVANGILNFTYLPLNQTRSLRTGD